jgi:hypothetical protein
MKFIETPSYPNVTSSANFLRSVGQGFLNPGHFKWALHSAAWQVPNFKSLEAILRIEAWTCQVSGIPYIVDVTE